jgi:PhnB protein
MKVQPYLFFDGRCEEALAFYQKAIGARTARLMRFKDNPEPPSADSGCQPTQPDKVMHASFQVGDTEIMASDGRCEGRPKFEGFSLTISAPDVAAADRMFAALSEGGQVQMPMTKTFFSPRFGMVADRFGVGWMIIVAQ